MSLRNLEFRIPYQCECGAGIVCKTKSVGQTKNCPDCKSEFVVPHPADSFWIVLPERSLDIYDSHAEAVWSYANAIHKTPELFLSKLRQILKTLWDIEIFASDIAKSDHNSHSDHRPEIEAALERLSIGQSFAGFTNPNLRQSNWSPEQSPQSQAEPPSVVSFVREAMVTLREIKKMMHEDLT